MLLAADVVVTGRKVLRPGWIDISGGIVVALGGGPPPRQPDRDYGDAIIVPGFVDTHVHGGGGFDFSTATEEAVLGAVDLHRRHGSTRLLASLVTADPDQLLWQIGRLAELVESGVLAGIHLEGPWLASARCGAHDPSSLRDPDPAEVERVLAAGRGTIRMVTLAPELPGALEAIRRVVDSGAVAAVGHTDATYSQTVAAIEAGATVGTHLFNAMRPIHHREPGPIVALLEDSRVTVEFIADGVHVAPALYRHVNTFGPDRVSLVTDAMSAAGVGDGRYRLGSLDVDVDAGVARIAGTDTIAGSTATMDQAFRFAVQHSGLSPDAALLRAVRQTSANPVRALGLSGGFLASGALADLAVLDATARVVSVFCEGRSVYS